MISFLFFCMILFISNTIHGSLQLEEFTANEIPRLIKESCLLVAPPTTNVIGVLPILQNLTKIFSNESAVKIGLLRRDSSYLTTQQDIHAQIITSLTNNSNGLIFYSRKKIDRKCLLKPPSTKLNNEPYKGPLTTKAVLEFLNLRCGTLRNLQGALSHAGRMRELILENLFGVKDVRHGDHEYNERNGQSGPVNVGAMCDRITMPTREEFIHKYLFRSKPVIITGAMDKWPAMSKWSNEFLTSKFGKNKVRVAFVPNSEYEGCEKASNFEDFKDFKLPEEVKANLPYLDLVVVRPAFLDIEFKEFMHLLDKTVNHDGQYANVSAYLEYSSIPNHLPELEKDVVEMPFVSGILKRKHLNIWLSNGNTLGKLHFDPFDNFLCQVSGKKELILYEPHDNTCLYEAHIQEAVLGYEPKTMKFRRKKLMDSTSMVMSPINILKPDFNRFPKFKNVKAMNCTINEGDVLYMPSFWWHEVQSYPNKELPRNLAINYWYEPFLTKEYPCDSCKMDVNPFYNHLLK